MIELDEADVPDGVIATILTVYEEAILKPVIVPGEDVIPVATILEPDVGVAVIVYDETVPTGGTKLIDAVVVVTAFTLKNCGGFGSVRIDIEEDDGDVPVALVAVIVIVYVILLVKPVREYGEVVMPVFVILILSDAVAFNVYEVTVPPSSVKLIDALLLVTLLELNPLGAGGTVTTCMLEEAGDVPYAVIVLIVIVYVMLDVNPVSE